MNEMVLRVAAEIRRVNEETVGLTFTELTDAMARAAIEAMSEPGPAPSDLAMFLRMHVNTPGPQKTWREMHAMMVDAALR